MRDVAPSQPAIVSDALDEFRRAVGPRHVLTEPAALVAYECDGLAHERGLPAAVILPGSTAEVQAIVRVCSRAKIPFVPRGHGTGLSGGAMPTPGSVVIGLSRLNRIRQIDLPNQRIVVEPGVTNLDITRAVADAGFYYAPDPSSQQVCSIGGNVAENSGGAHCLKYGFTVHHVLSIEAVLPDGSLVEIGHALADTPGPGVLGLIVGSEGTLAIVTAVTARILRRPAAVKTLLAAFDSLDAGGAVVSDIIAYGIVPAAIEMMDRLAVRAAEATVQCGFPVAEAVLIVELDGPAAEVDESFEAITAICRAHGASHLEVTSSDAERARIWKGRKAAFAAMGRIARNYYVQDGVVPRSKLSEVLARIKALEARSGLAIANVFHAGDGNLHPLVCYDGRVPGETEKAADVASEILTYCIDAGGALSGEHGIGADKACAMPRMFSPADLALMTRTRAAIDPAGLANPDKIFPTPRLCGEVPGPYHPHRIEREGLGERV